MFSFLSIVHLDPELTVFSSTRVSKSEPICQRGELGEGLTKQPKEQETSRASRASRPEQGLANSQEAGSSQSIYVNTFTLMRAFLVPISLRKKP